MNAKKSLAITIVVALSGCSIDQLCFPDFQDCLGEETGGEEHTDEAWCMQNPMYPDEPIRSFCYPIEQSQPEGYIATPCAAVFDFPTWNYDGTCAPGSCSEQPRTARLCFDDSQAGAVSMKAPGDRSVRVCWEDAISNGDTEPSMYLSMDYHDDSMMEPMCAPQETVSELGPTCSHNLGAVCLSHNLFCTCFCDSDQDCGAPTVCEGYHPGALVPTFCVAPFA